MQYVKSTKAILGIMGAAVARSRLALLGQRPPGLGLAAGQAAMATTCSFLWPDARLYAKPCCGSAPALEGPAAAAFGLRRKRAVP